MDVNKRGNALQLLTGLIPIVLSIVFLIYRSRLLLFVCVLSLFLIIGIVPIYRKRENLYMFILVAVSGLPINIFLSFWLVMYEELISSGFLIGDIIWCALLCCVFFSVEEIVFGVITRLIWKRQYRVKI